MKAEKRKGSIIFEVAALFLLGVIVTGILTYVSETRLYASSVRKQTELQAAQIAEETKQAVLEYAAYPWLIRYWYTNAEELEVEYDAGYAENTATARKCSTFSRRHPGLQIKYLNAAQIEALPEEDQKLYAEIAYAWLITRIDQIKQAYRVDYLFCVISEAPYTRQFFLFSAADKGALRGTDYEQVYPLGHTVEVSESQAEAMRSAVLYTNYLADAGNYVDFYSSLFSFDGHSVQIGLTYGLSDLQADVQSQTRTGAKLAILNQLALSAICLCLIYVFVLRPLKKVQGSIRRYKNTKASEAVVAELAGVRSRNEIGSLAVDVTEMVREIDAHMDEIRTITAEKERIGTELSLAARIQAAMLPDSAAFPERTEFKLSASMEPAKAVGGDFYDFFLVDEDHLGLVIADVSGKGVPAALFMMVSMLLIKNHVASGLSPAAALEVTNRQLCAKNREEMFVTVWLGILELSTGRLTAANAGHEYPVLREPDGRFALHKDKHGFIIGGIDGMKYHDYTLQLAPGAGIFVYTDGVPEATDAKEELFGLDRMLAALNEDPDAAPERLLRNVRAAVDGFVGAAEQFDDLTMLCLEYRGQERAGAEETPAPGAAAQQEETK